MIIRERSPKLTNNQRRVLNALYGGDLSRSQIARVLNCPSGQVTVFMEPLIHKGLAERIGDDWRAV